MSVKLHQNTVEAYPYDEVDGVDDALITMIWRALNKRLPRERVSCVVAEVALEFQDATVKTFLPIFVHRRVLEQLTQELNEMDFTDNHIG